MRSSFISASSARYFSQITHSFAALTRWPYISGCWLSETYAADVPNTAAQRIAVATCHPNPACVAMAPKIVARPDSDSRISFAYEFHLAIFAAASAWAS
ncbi:MAG TPA: hypothetical protein VEL51_07820 [Vicinamibacterales bacterium]|nr:hypothetical protein [Vicinamibacterales bacterium]